jgi:hypothetical protein
MEWRCPAFIRERPVGPRKGCSQHRVPRAPASQEDEVIRITDEKIFSMTRFEYTHRMSQYLANTVCTAPEYTQTFEQWLGAQGYSYTTHREENP